MIITAQKDLNEILKHLEGERKVFIVGCGECSTTCKTGGEDEVRRMKELLEGAGKAVTGAAVPTAPCIAAKVKLELVKHRRALEEADSVVVLACGLGIQSVKENLRSGKPVHVGCDTLFMGTIDKDNVFLERCSACGECVLELTGGICPVTRCAKSLLNGPCGGQNKGKCEVDRERDCVWVLIYDELKKAGRLGLMSERRSPKDHSKAVRPRSRDIRSAPARGGFTLVEIMIVVAIVAILASVAVVGYIKAKDSTEKNVCIENLKQIDGAVQRWALESGALSMTVPSTADIVPHYMKAWPSCRGVAYAPPAVSATVTCPNSLEGHIVQ